MDHFPFDIWSFATVVDFSSMFSTWTLMECTYMTRTSDTQPTISDGCLKLMMIELKFVLWVGLKSLIFFRISILKADFLHTALFPVDWCNKIFWHDFSLKKVSGIKSNFYPTQPQVCGNGTLAKWPSRGGTLASPRLYPIDPHHIQDLSSDFHALGVVCSLTITPNTHLTH